MAAIKFNPKFLDVVNSLTTINSAVVFEKEDDKIFISRSNPSTTIAYHLRAPMDQFAFESEKIAFYNFPEFVQLLSVFETPEILINENKMVISQNTSKIKYVLSDAETIKAGPRKINLPSCEAVLKLNSAELQNIKKMVGLVTAKYVKFTVDGKKVNVTLFNAGHDNSYEKDYELVEESKETFSFKVASDVFTLIPNNDYTLDLSKNEVVKIHYNHETIDLNIFVAGVED